MLEWLSDNLATFLVGLFGAGGWLGFIVNKYNENKENRLQTNKELKAESDFCNVVCGFFGIASS